MRLVIGDDALRDRNIFGCETTCQSKGNQHRASGLLPIRGKISSWVFLISETK